MTAVGALTETQGPSKEPCVLARDTHTHTHRHTHRQSHSTQTWYNVVHLSREVRVHAAHDLEAKASILALHVDVELSLGGRSSGGGWDRGGGWGGSRSGGRRAGYRRFSFGLSL